MVRLQGVTKRFGAVTAVEDVDVTVEAGEIVAVLGPSGCGKTTLLRLIAGFEAPDAGSVHVERRVVAGPAWVPPERRHVGMVFQDYALFPHRTVADNVGFGLARARRGRRVPEVLALVGLDGQGGRYPHELSGGQQQRVALARALAPEPATILLDEPWSNIDPLLRGSMRAEVVEILRRAGTTAVVVTHDQEEAFSVADRIVLLRDGRVVQAGAPEAVYTSPVDRWAATFVGAANFVVGDVSDGRVATPLGTFVVDRETGGRVEVLVRPELLELLPAPTGSAQVVGREFRGHDVFYRIVLADGETVFAHRPSNEVVPLGARVDVRLHDRAPVVFG
ncbi:MAG: Cell division transporter, ATP-binding protein FtsE [uncultured Thermoleophilia bacterium]|uniref:ABC-type quaternary amine transporter n=1 Tax=uncultured Thermoleophilia bacterium TaxID=1497501 RepID=A0A6J4UNK9_9ACTN|nr:MAG: Cell division transporter, ATP-binding protein FtsE [uncultured Thermoleophilia bacterium]